MKYYKDNIFTKIAYKHNTRPNSFGKLNRLDLELLYIVQNNYCPLTEDFISITYNAQLDHIIPISKGGLNIIGNVVFVSTYANVQKSNNHLIDFLGIEYYHVVRKRIFAIHEARIYLKGLLFGKQTINQRYTRGF